MAKSKVLHNILYNTVLYTHWKQLFRYLRHGDVWKCH